jgi:hypothetical protein
MSKRMQKWVTRTIKNGAVKIGGVTFRPFSLEGEMPYDGRWEGRQARFARYWTEDWYQLHVWLQGFADEDPEVWPGDTCVDGVFLWSDWMADKETTITVATDETRKQGERWFAACRLATWYGDKSFYNAMIERRNGTR